MARKKRRKKAPRSALRRAILAKLRSTALSSKCLDNERDRLRVASVLSRNLEKHNLRGMPNRWRLSHS